MDHEHDRANRDYVKIVVDRNWRKLGKEYPLNDYPTAESLWGLPASKGLYSIENIPFRAMGLSYLDIVSARVRSDDGRLFFEKVEKDSGHSTVRVILRESSPQGTADLRRLKGTLLERGCIVEDMAIGLAIDVPPTVGLEGILAILEAGTKHWVVEVGKSARYRGGSDLSPGT